MSQPESMKVWTITLEVVAPATETAEAIQALITRAVDDDVRVGERIYDVTDVTATEAPWAAAELQHLRTTLKDSGAFLSLFTEGWQRDPTCLLQLGFAMMLEKPILLLVPQGLRVPPALQRIADRIEAYDPADPASLEAATRALVGRAAEAQE